MYTVMAAKGGVEVRVDVPDVGEYVVPGESRLLLDRKRMAEEVPCAAARRQHALTYLSSFDLTEQEARTARELLSGDPVPFEVDGIGTVVLEVEEGE